MHHPEHGGSARLVATRLLLALGLTSAMLASQDPIVARADAPAAQPPAGFAKAWRSVVEEYHQLVEAQAIVGSSLGFFQGQHTLGSEVHGHADLATQRRVDEHTIYHWASITKTFTGIAIMQLRDRGRLRLDDPIIDYLPELRKVHNPFGPLRAITLRHLLTHTSGFRGRTWPWGGKAWHPHEPTEWSQLVAMLPYTEIEFEPGTKVSYSNPGVIFLGRVIEILSGDDYEVYMDKNVLRPLGMHSSYFDHTPYHLLQHRSANYTLEDGKPLSGGLDFDTGITVSNGGLNASVPDMLRYLRFLVGCADTEAARGVLQRSSLSEMWQPHKLASGADTYMGLSFFRSKMGGIELVGHTGGQKSFSSFIYVDPKAQTGCIAAFNTAGKAIGRGTRSAFGTTRQRIFKEIFPLFAPAR